MNETLYLILLVLVTWAADVGLRAFPFLVFGGGKKNSPLMDYLGKMLAPAAMAMLIVYCYSSICGSMQGADLKNGLSGILSGIVVIALQYFFRNSLVSILVGTILNMALLQCL